MRTAIHLAHGICFSSVCCCCIIRRFDSFECIRLHLSRYSSIGLRGAQVKAPGKHIRIHSRPANFAPLGCFMNSTMVVWLQRLVLSTEAGNSRHHRHLCRHPTFPALWEFFLQTSPEPLEENLVLNLARTPRRKPGKAWCNSHVERRALLANLKRWPPSVSARWADI